MKKGHCWFIVCLGVALGACTRDGSTGGPTPVGLLPTPTGAAGVGVEQPTATRAVAATVTSLPPPPTLTAAPTVTAPATATVTATPGAVLLLTAEDFGEGRNPLTGEQVADPAALERRPIAAKVSNAPAQWVRPQSGLSLADLVFEHLSEGGITRFTAVFYGQTPPEVGPVRSARLIDLEIPAMYDAALAFSGASTGVSQLLQQSDIRPRLIRDGSPGFFRTGADKPWEHTLHARGEGLWQAVEARGENRRPTFSSNMAFGSEPPGGGEPASAVSINYRNFALVEWGYDPASGRYRRSIDGEPHIEAITGEQLTAANVVVIFADHETDTSICENLQNNVCLAFSIRIKIWGEGEALVIRDGQVYEATWRRPNRSDMLTLVDTAGNPLPLQIGNTWFQVAPPNYAEEVTISP